MSLTLHNSFNIQKQSLQILSSASKVNNSSFVSFANRSEIKNDEFSSSGSAFDENIEVVIQNKEYVQLKGTLDNKKYYMELKTKRNSEKNIDIFGEYNSKKANIDAKYNSINKYFKGRLGSDDFNLTFHDPVLFGSYSLKGRINGETVKLKFPGGAVDAKNRDIILLILSLTGSQADIEGGKLGILNYSDTCIDYFDYEDDEIEEDIEEEEDEDDYFEEERSLLDNIW